MEQSTKEGGMKGRRGNYWKKLPLLSPRGLQIMGILSLLSFSGGYSVAQAAHDYSLPLAQSTEEPVEVDPHAAFTLDNVLIRLNETRIANGLEQLPPDTYLSKEASDDLAGNCPVVSHDRFREKIDQGVFNGYGSVGEALNSGSETPKEAIANFMASPTHRQAILDTKSTKVGIGIVTSPVKCVSLIFSRGNR